MKQRVLLLCTGNSARSQMAEGLVNYFLGETWEAYSAGTRPSGYVHTLAAQVMLELGIDISDQRSKSADEFRGSAFDTVVTLCDDAAQKCPLWLGGGRAVHIAFEDPAMATGSKEERLAVFRQVRDQIRRRILDLLVESSQA